jgi:secreted PhoX family phosphatase
MKAMWSAAAATAVPSWFAAAKARASAILAQPSTLTFAEIANRIDHDHHVASGYTPQIVLRWGDPLWSDAPLFNPASLKAAEQCRQFGYNNDFIAYMPLPRGSSNSEHGLLCINHEYTNPHLMWPGLTEAERLHLTKEQCEYEMAAHGHTVVEVKRENGVWRTVLDSAYTRRFSAIGPTMNISGPARGHERLRTAADSTGTRVQGTLNNCAGGVTPWGTVLIAEENFNKYFSGSFETTREQRNYSRLTFGPKTLEYAWHQFFDRFSIDREPNEANRFGWFVEFDPYDPQCVPVKRTALGRFKHEGAAIVLNHDGRVVVYSGDDERNEYVYRFVSSARLNPNDRHANRDILDEGTLSVAKFHADGTATWLPLTWGAGGLTPENGFHSHADTVIEARTAADLVGATPMDRPEDVEFNPITGSIFVILTNNPKRAGDAIDAANPRAGNRFGHIIEMIPPGSSAARDHAAETFNWKIFLLAGNPDVKDHQAIYHPAVSKNGWLACPDNAAIDHKGRLWICTDQGEYQAHNRIPDGIWATDVTGEGRALTRLFYAVPTGAEMCGPCFTPDCTTLFVAVQHPGEDFNSTYDHPSTRWPDFQHNVPPRPAVVAITKDDGGEIGT